MTAAQREDTSPYLESETSFTMAHRLPSSIQWESNSWGNTSQGYGHSDYALSVWNESSHVPGRHNSYNSTGNHWRNGSADRSRNEHPRKLFIRMKEWEKVDENEGPEAAMKRQKFYEHGFQRYQDPFQGCLGMVKVVAPQGRAFIFVKFGSKEMADLAFVELGQYFEVQRARC